MKTYKVTLHRTEYFYEVIEVEAESEEEAEETAWDKRGNWQLANAEDYVSDILDTEELSA